jgi:hypothetical protein
MPQERRIRPEDAHELARLLRQAFLSGDDHVSLHWIETPMVLERVSDVEFLMRLPDQPDGTRIILGSDVRPDAYPAEFPYIPHEIAMVGASPFPSMATWWSTGDLDAILAEIERQCVASGWTRIDDTPAPDVDAIRHEYEKAGMRRYLGLGQGILSLIQRG